MNGNAQQVDMRGNPVRRVVDMTTRRSFVPSTVAKPWDMTISGTTATFTRCYYQRQMLTKECANVSSGVLTGTITATGTRFIGVSIADETGNGTIIEGATLASVTDATAPADESASKRPLFEILNGSIVADLRSLPQLGYYQ